MKLRKTIPLLLCLFAINTIALAQPCAEKKVLIEMACAKNCGPCVYKIEELREFYDLHKEEICLVVYNQAPVGLGNWGESDKPYFGFYDQFNLDYQSSRLVDRTFMPDNNDEYEGDDSEAIDDLETAFNQQIDIDYVPVSINISPDYDAATREVTVDLEANFCDEASGDMRIYLVLVQDIVIGPEGVEYGQNTLPAAAAEYGYTEENGYTIIDDDGPLWISQFPFYQVVKYQPSGFFGNAGVISETVSAGDSFTETYTFTLPEFGDESSVVPLDPTSVEILAAVVRNGGHGEREVLNANKTRLLSGEELGIEEVSENEFGLGLIQNPVVSGTQLSIKLYGNTTQKTDLVLYNAQGNQVSILKQGISLTNDTEQILTVPVDYAPGIYFLSLRTNGKQFTQKLIIQ